ncbi:MAG TPA: serine/threonine-protein kinase [Gemmatimonadales bacterium]|nr:serine/threonine-protein kinase [Gemmatimonadales bacterium]
MAARSVAADSGLGIQGQGEDHEAVVPTAIDTLFLEFQTALAGRYSLERELGRGGMGVVYLAREVALERLVAIKLLPPDLAAQIGLRDRFLREARTAAQLSQPNIVPIHTVDEVGGFVFFVMTYIEGETLGERVRSRGPLSPSECGRILREIAWALAYAHGQGVIHRDLKPDNIILERATGRAVLTDFGIARRLETTGLTAGGELIGTPEYMSPEQATGAELDGRTDLYSLGIVGFYALSGRLPFEGDTIPSLLLQRATAAAPPVARFAPSTPRALGQAVARCLQQRPEDRYSDAKGFADALSVALEARREVPAPVRAFVKRSLEINPAGCLYLIAAVYVGPMLIAFLFGPLMRAGVAAMMSVYLGYMALVLVVVPVVAHVNRVRRLVRSGYGVDDVLAGAQADMDQRKEELAVTVGREPSQLERVLPPLGWAAFAASIVSAALLMAGLLPRLQGKISLGIMLGIVVWVAGLVVGRRRRDVLGERRVKYWGGKFGRWLFKIAAQGLPALSPGAGATHRPTELAIAFAAEDLYAGLPKEVRASLPELPGVLSRLEKQARAVRARLDQLEQSLQDIAGTASPDGAAGHRDSLTADLTAARDEARVRLAETVAALEIIRLDLLRLRAGASGIDRITADLAAAGEIGEAVDRLLAAGAEVDEALRDDARTQGHRDPGTGRTL